MNTEARLPQIDPVTFAALNTLDMFIARAPLTRGEHAEANKSLQHLVQTLEMLQSAVKQLNARAPGAEESGGSSGGGHAGSPNGGGRIVAEVAEEIFRNAKG